MKYRINRRDARNWTIERWQEGGKIIDRGRYAGQETREGWDTVNPIGYFSGLKYAAKRLLDVIVGDEWPADGWTGQDLSAALERAVGRVEAIVAGANLEPQTAVGASPNPAAEWPAEWKERVRTAGDPVRAYLNLSGGKRFKRTTDEMARKLSPKEAAIERVS